MQNPNTLKSYPLEGAVLGQAWIYQTDVGIFGTYQYQDLEIRLHEFAHVQSIKNYLLERGTIHSVLTECLTCYTSFKQAAATISDRTPKGVDLVKLGVQDPNEFKTLIPYTIRNLLTRLNDQLTSNQPLIQSEEVNDLIKTLLHYDVVSDQLKKVNPILDDLNESISSTENIENSKNIIE